MHVIEFTPDGKAECLHSDAVPLGELGKLKMERASTIEWQEEEQYWRIFRGNGRKEELANFASRQDALDWEREFFNYEILNR